MSEEQNKYALLQTVAPPKPQRELTTWEERQEQKKAEEDAIRNRVRGARTDKAVFIPALPKPKYHITEDELVHGNYSNMKKMYNDEMLDQQYNIRMLDKMLPSVCTPTALENNNFKQAYILDEKIIKCIKQESVDLADDDMEKCLEYYNAAIDEKVIEASANLLRQLFLVGMITCWMNPKFMDEYEGIKESPKKLVQAMYLSSYDEEADSEWLQQREAFLEEYEVQIVLNIYRLKHSSEYADLGDFYMALRYIFGMVRNANSPELNSTIGYQMMSEFSMLGNIYADKFSSK